MMIPAKKDVATFTYKGKDNMLFNRKRVLSPPKNPPKSFEAGLVLHTGEKIPAEGEWRQRIWNWWSKARADEIATNLLLQASYDMKTKGRAEREYMLRED